MNFAEKLMKLFERAIKRKLNQKEKKMFLTLIFLMRLLLLSIPLYLVIAYQIPLIPMQQAVASQSENVLNAIGYHAQRNGTQIKISKEKPFTFMISEDCTGWKSMLFFFALIFAVPGVAMLKRVYGLVFGLPAIWFGNIIRIVVVVFSENNFGYSAAMVIHNYLWQAGLITLVLSLWFLWIKMFHIFRT